MWSWHSDLVCSCQRPIWSCQPIILIQYSPIKYDLMRPFWSERLVQSNSSMFWSSPGSDTNSTLLPHSAIHHTSYILTARRGTQWAEYPVHCCGSTTRSIMSAGAGRRGWAGYPTTLQVIRLWCNDAAVFTKLINLHKTVLCKLIPILRVGWFHAVLLTAFAVLHWWMVSSATAASQHSGQQAAFRHHLVAF